MYRTTHDHEEEKCQKALTKLITSPIRQISTPIREISSQISTPIREISSPILQVSSQSIQKAVNRTKTPTSKSEIRHKIRHVDFQDPEAVVELASRLTSKRRKDSINIGKHVGNETYFYSIHFGGQFFPTDYFPDPTRPPTALTHIKCNSPLLPKIFFQLGRLHCTKVSDTNLRDSYEPVYDPTSGADTFFVIGVNIVDRMAWALWNPDEFDEIDGILPGFHKASTAIPLNQNIDDLLANKSSHYLDLNPENFVTLPPGSSVKYGGVDEEGWNVLSRMSSKYKRASKIRIRASSD